MISSEDISSADITELLAAVRRGEDGAMDQLFPRVYEQIQAMAHRELRHGRPGDTLDTTALVHEAYLKLVDQSQAQWKDRTHFLSVAALAMRHILVDYARRRSAKKRGGGEHHRLRLDMEDEVGVEAQAFEVLMIDQALEALSAVSPRLGKLVELRFFGGLTVEETAEVMETSERTVKRDWRKARAFLFRKLDSPVDFPVDPPEA